MVILRLEICNQAVVKVPKLSGIPLATTIKYLFSEVTLEGDPPAFVGDVLIAFDIQIYLLTLPNR